MPTMKGYDPNSFAYIGKDRYRANAFGEIEVPEIPESTPDTAKENETGSLLDELREREEKIKADEERLTLESEKQAARAAELEKAEQANLETAERLKREAEELAEKAASAAPTEDPRTEPEKPEATGSEGTDENPSGKDAKKNAKKSS